MGKSDNTCVTPAKLQTERLLGGVVLLVGLGGLACDFLRIPEEQSLNVHVLFGAVLLAAVTRSLFRAWHPSDGFDARRFYIGARRLARWIYRLLYFMAGVRLCLYGIDTGVLNKGLKAFNALSTERTLDDFQVYIGFGLIAVCLIRICAMFTVARTSGRETS